MKESEAREIVAMVGGAWPRQQLPPSTVAVWSLALSDLDFAATKAAVVRLVQTSKWPPTVAEIREAVAQARVSLPTAEEAWGIVRRAISRHGSYIAPGFDCDEIQDAVDVMGWVDLCNGENPVANRARFIDAFRGFAARRMQAEATGTYRAPARVLPMPLGAARVAIARGERVLIETGYPSPAPQPALGLAGGAPEGRQLVALLATKLARFS